MEHFDTRISVPDNISSILKFGVERILSNEFCPNKPKAPLIVQISNQYSSSPCLCAGSYSKCATFCNFVQSPSYVSVLEKYQNLYRPAPMRPVPRGLYKIN